MIDTNILHPSFKFGENFNIGHFCIIEEDVIVGDNVTIGNYVLLKKGTRIGNDCFVDSYFKSSGDNLIGNGVTLRFNSTIARKVVVEDNVFIAPNVMTVYSQPDGSKGTETRIGEGSFISTSAVISSDVIIVPGCIIGTNSFVKNSCLKRGVYVGNPATLVREL